MIYTANAPMDFKLANNIRELGGYKNKDGVSLKKHKLLRGGDLSLLTDNELSCLEDYGIRASIDLRSSIEKKNADPFYDHSSLVYYAIPIEGNVDVNGRPEDLLYTLYIDILENHQDALRRELGIISREKDGVIFHCTAGKDRTGLTAMFILAACNVCENQIIADYAASEENNKDVTSRQLKQLEAAGLNHIPMEVFRSDPENMRRTLAYLKEHYDGPVGYMKTIGVTDEEIENIRKKMLEE